MSIRILPENLVNQIAAGEVVERPASVVKELVENALDAGADQIVVDIVDGGRTLISVIDNGVGMTRDDLTRALERHATSKLPDDDLLNINYMGFRGEALPSIASVAEMSIDTYNVAEKHGWRLNCSTMEIKPSDWESGTRIRVENLFSKTPARLKFLRGDRAELMSIVDVVKRLAMSRMDVGFVLNNKWRFPKNQSPIERIVDVMGSDVKNRMLEIDDYSKSSNMKLYGFISEPTLRRASSVDEYLFVNGRSVKDKVLIGALRAAYMDVMHAREFPLCALYLSLDNKNVDVNVSPSKTDVHFLEPEHVRAFIIKALRERLSKTMNQVVIGTGKSFERFFQPELQNVITNNERLSSDYKKSFAFRDEFKPTVNDVVCRLEKQNEIYSDDTDVFDKPLGRPLAQIGNKYILAQSGENLIIVDQHAAHERITYEHLRNHKIKAQPLLAPIVVNMRCEDVDAILTIRDELKISGVILDAFGDNAIAIFEKPADWEFNWNDLLHSIADEVRVNGHSSQLNEKLHLKLANYACHHSVRAGQKLDMLQMDVLLRDIENTERAGQCNHGRPVYKIIPFTEIDTWFER